VVAVLLEDVLAVFPEAEVDMQLEPACAASGFAMKVTLMPDSSATSFRHCLKITCRSACRALRHSARELVLAIAHSPSRSPPARRRA